MIDNMTTLRHLQREWEREIRRLRLIHEAERAAQLKKDAAKDERPRKPRDHPKAA